MNNKSASWYFGVIFCILLPFYSNSQSTASCDTLYFRDGQIVAATIKTIEKETVIYGLCGDSSLKLTLINTERLDKIRFSGKKLKSYSVVPKDSTDIFQITMLDGRKIKGCIIEDNAVAITVVKENQEIIELRRSKIQSILKIKRGVSLGRSILDRSVGSHYLMGANNIPLRNGEGYFQNGDVLFNQARYGITDYLSFSAGLFPLGLLEERPALLWISPKLAFPLVKDHLYIGGSALFSRITGDGGENFGFYNGSLTWGSVRKNVTVGIGRLFIDNEWEENPSFSLGFTLTPVKWLSIVSESYSRVEDHRWGIATISGLRFYLKKATLDLAFLALVDDGDHTTLPWFSCTFPFGGNK